MNTPSNAGKEIACGNSIVAITDESRRRFFTKFAKAVDSECWNWMYASDQDGYGQMKVGGKMIRGHRISWAIHNGSVPRGLLVLHRCDNPRCVNPTHLFLGSHADNAADKVSKRRQARGKALADRIPVPALRTHCSKGHEYTEENTRFTNGRRHCRACHREFAKKYYRAARAATEEGKRG